MANILQAVTCIDEDETPFCLDQEAVRGNVGKDTLLAPSKKAPPKGQCVPQLRWWIRTACS